MHSLRPICAISIFIIATSFTASAHAIAVSDVVVFSTLTISSISSDSGDLDNLLIEGEANIVDSDAFNDGNAIANADGAVFPDTTTVLGEGDAIEQTALVSSSANPGGIAEAIFLTDGFLSLENLSTSATFTIGLEFAYDITVSARVDNPIDEFAFALAEITLTSLDFDTIFEDILLSVDTDFNPLDNPIFASDSQAFDIVLTPGQTESLFILADGESLSLAFAAVPLPASSSLFALALVLLCWERLQKAERLK